MKIEKIKRLLINQQSLLENSEETGGNSEETPEFRKNSNGVYFDRSGNEVTNPYSNVKSAIQRVSLIKAIPLDTTLDNLKNPEPEDEDNPEMPDNYDDNEDNPEMPDNYDDDDNEDNPEIPTDWDDDEDNPEIPIDTDLDEVDATTPNKTVRKKSGSKTGTSNSDIRNISNMYPKIWTDKVILKQFPAFLGNKEVLDYIKKLLNSRIEKIKSIEIADDLKELGIQPDFDTEEFTDNDTGKKTIKKGNKKEYLKLLEYLSSRYWANLLAKKLAEKKANITWDDIVKNNIKALSDKTVSPIYAYLTPEWVYSNFGEDIDLGDIKRELIKYHSTFAQHQLRSSAKGAVTKESNKVTYKMLLQAFHKEIVPFIEKPLGDLIQIAWDNVFTNEDISSKIESIKTSILDIANEKVSLWVIEIDPETKEQTYKEEITTIVLKWKLFWKKFEKSVNNYANKDGFFKLIDFLDGIKNPKNPGESDTRYSSKNKYFIASIEEPSPKYEGNISLLLSLNTCYSAAVSTKGGDQYLLRETLIRNPFYKKIENPQTELEKALSKEELPHYELLALYKAEFIEKALPKPQFIAIPFIRRIVLKLLNPYLSEGIHTLGQLANWMSRLDLSKEKETRNHLSADEKAAYEKAPVATGEFKLDSTYGLIGKDNVDLSKQSMLKKYNIPTTESINFSGLYNLLNTLPLFKEFKKSNNSILLENLDTSTNGVILVLVQTPENFIKIYNKMLEFDITLDSQFNWDVWKENTCVLIDLVDNLAVTISIEGDVLQKYWKDSVEILDEDKFIEAGCTNLTKEQVKQIEDFNWDNIIIEFDGNDTNINENMKKVIDIEEAAKTGLSLIFAEFPQFKTGYVNLKTVTPRLATTNLFRCCLNISESGKLQGNVYKTNFMKHVMMLKSQK
jgi:hypothetical protein